MLGTLRMRLSYAVTVIGVGLAVWICAPRAELHPVLDAAGLAAQVITDEADVLVASTTPSADASASLAPSSSPNARPETAKTRGAPARRPSLQPTLQPSLD